MVHILLVNTVGFGGGPKFYGSSASTKCLSNGHLDLPPETFLLEGAVTNPERKYPAHANTQGHAPTPTATLTPPPQERVVCNALAQECTHTCTYIL